MRKHLRSITLWTVLFFTVPVTTGFCCCVSDSVSKSFGKDSHQNCPYEERTPDKQPVGSPCQTSNLSGLIEKSSDLQLSKTFRVIASAMIESQYPEISKTHFVPFLDLGSPGPRLIANPQYLEVLRV